MAVLKIASIIAKKRAADIAKKKLAKVSTQEARKAAREMNQRIGGTKPLTRPRGSGNLATRPVNVPKKTTIKSIPKKLPEQTSKERAINKSLQRENFWSGMKNPPKIKPRPTNVLHNRPITERQNQMNEFSLKRMGKERRKIEKTYKGIRKGRVQESTPKRSIYEREMNIPAGTGRSVQRQQSVKQFKQEVQAKKIAQSDWQKQIRDSVLNPATPTKNSRIDKLGKTRIAHPSKSETPWQMDKNAINAVREAEKLAKRNKTRKYGTGGGRPARGK